MGEANVILGDSLEALKQERKRKRLHEWYLKNKGKIKLRVSKHYKKYCQDIKKEVLAFYSNNSVPKCLWCGEARLACLSIDHIDGGGKRERKKLGIPSGWAFYRFLKKQGFPEGYQTLCMNCQFIKREGNRNERRSCS